MLKRASLAKSVVGLTGSLAGAISCLPLFFPDIIRIYKIIKRGQK